jgi:peptidoglycan/LPS O-acetylase OafA/YrhL
MHAFFITLAGGWLFAQPAVLALKPIMRTALLTAITLPGSYLVAWLLHNGIEQPGIKLGRRLLAQRKIAVPSGRLAAATSEPSET